MARKDFSTQERFIFISYRHEDKNRVVPLVRALERAGYRVWYDKKLTMGNPFSNEIMEKIGASFVVMPFLSSNYISSEFCLKELRLAKEWGKYVFPVFLEENVRFEAKDIELSAWCTSVQSVILDDLSDTRLALFEIESCKLLKTCHVSQTIGYESTKTDETIRTEKSKKWLVYPIVMALVAALGVGAWSQFLRSPTYNISAAPKEYSYTDKKVEATDYSTLPEDIRDEALESNPDYEVSYSKRKAEASFSEWCTLGVNNDILYPGALLDVKNGEIKPLGTSLERRDINISANFESLLKENGQKTNLVQTVYPSLSNVNQAINDIVNENLSVSTALPSSVSMQIYEVDSEEDFYLGLGLGLDVAGFSLAETFESSKVEHQSNLVVVLKQIYYTVSCDYNGNPRKFFAQTTTTGAIQKDLNGKVPAYVSSVSYGRIVMISIQSDYSVEEIKNALSIGWGSSGTTSFIKDKGYDVGVQLDNTIQNIAKDKSTKISYFSYGDTAQNSADVISAIYNGETGNLLYDIFNKDFDVSNVSGARPITYTIRNFDGSLAGVTRAEDEYTVKKVSYIPKRLMDWNTYTSMMEDGSIKKKESLTLDLSGLVNFSNPEETENQANITITVPENIKTLTLVGPNDVTSGEIVYKNLSIFIQNPIKLILKNISFVGREGIPAIYTADMMHDFAVECDGAVNIQGGLGAAGIEVNGELRMTVNRVTSVQGGMSTDTEAGEEGMKVLGKLDIELKDYAKLVVIGGNGKDGTGEDGGHGMTAGSVSVNGTANSELFLSGGRGGNGVSSSKVADETGAIDFSKSRGGNGGNAIVASETAIGIIKGTSIIQGGVGGVGGNTPLAGCNGGNGGAGVIGTLSLSSSCQIQGGKGGKGTGSAGNGGNGGSALIGNLQTETFHHSLAGGMGGEGSVDGEDGANGAIVSVAVVHLNANGGSVSVGSVFVSVADNGTYGQLPTPIRVGCDFAGWYTSLEGGKKVCEGDKVDFDGAGTIYARWMPRTDAIITLGKANTSRYMIRCWDSNKDYRSGKDKIAPNLDINALMTLGYKKINVTMTFDYTVEDWGNQAIKILGNEDKELKRFQYEWESCGWRKKSVSFELSLLDIGNNGDFQIHWHWFADGAGSDTWYVGGTTLIITAQK